ncbi:hypothetical protein FACS189413_12250 [Bacteroidia bacterium]|nr:hypothetical protein FACS189413_12250 [Bacteroidia bacterium]
MTIHEFYHRGIPANIKQILWNLFWQIKFIIRFLPQHIEASINYLLHNRDAFEHQLIIITKVKNEADNLKEWIEYNKLTGVEKFIIYDNESNDHTKEVLQPYIDSGEVDYIFYPGILKRPVQAKIVDEAVRRYRNKTKWIAVVDVDEFIIPVQTGNILNTIADIEKDLGKKINALAINWVMYGYNGHRVKPGGLVIENYTKHDGINPHIKSIVNPRFVIRYHIHNAIYLFAIPARNEKGIAVREGVVQNLSDISIEKIRINHYYTKSYEEHIQKIGRYHAMLNIQEEEIPVFDPEFMSHHEDRIMDKYIPLLHMDSVLTDIVN